MNADVRDPLFENGGEVGALMQELDWEATPLGQPSAVQTPSAQAPRELLSASYIRAIVTSHHPEHPNWLHPVHVFFRRTNAGWQTVGLERIVPIG